MARRALLLLALTACLVDSAACSRGAPLDDAPVAAAPAAGAGSGIPPAASSAYVVLPGATAVSGPWADAGVLGGPLLLPPGVLPTAHVRDDGATFTGSGLPPEVILRIVRQNFGRARLCYSAGLRGDPTLAGGVRVRFVIDKRGAVASVSDAGSTLPDKATVACVERMFTFLSFPAPSGGPVAVVYSLTFSSGPP
ncbi:MAG TPA: AgmX/PglI C-terminal domain-containing protein [Polyangiaceae bacterium]